MRFFKYIVQHLTRSCLVKDIKQMSYTCFSTSWYWLYKPQAEALSWLENEVEVHKDSKETVTGLYENTALSKLNPNSGY